MGLLITILIFPIFRNFFRKIRHPISFSIISGWLALIVDQWLLTQFAQRLATSDMGSNSVQLTYASLAFIFSLVVVFLALISFDKGCRAVQISRDKLVLIAILFWQVWLKVLYGIAGCLGAVIFKSFSIFYLTILISLLHSLVISIRAFRIYKIPVT